MKTLTSRDNPFYKQLKKLAGATPYQRRAGQVLLEGLHLAGAYLDWAGQPRACVVTERAMSLAQTREIVARVEQSRTMLLDEALFGPLSGVVNGVGLLFVIDLPAPILPSRITDTCVILDRIQDAGNAGSILRSAAAAKVSQVLCTPGTVSAWSAKVVRAAMGAHFLLTIHERVDLKILISHLAVPIVMTDAHGAISIYDCDLSQPLAWVFGNEGEGASPLWREAQAQSVVIPQPGAMESLNVAAAAAICLFEQCRQQQKIVRKDGHVSGRKI
jgi:RNA methyltransferase, TrmH family